MENKKDRKLDGLIILCVALLGFIVSVVSFFWRRSGQIQSFVFGEEGIFYLFVLYYGVWGYKKPHGNLLRYLMLLLAAVTAATILMQIDHWDAPWPVIFSSNLAAVLIGYMAGRLHKVKKNRCVAAAVTVLLLIRCFWPMGRVDYAGLVRFFYILDRSTALFTWLTVMLIYFFRYREHREAGVAEDAA